MSLIQMRTFLLVIFVFFVDFSPSYAGNPRAKEDIADPDEEYVVENDNSESSGTSSSGKHAAFAYTHLLPTPVNIPGGSWMLGTVSGVGITDHLQITTNVVRDAYGYFNAQAKAPLIEFPTFIAAASVGYENYDLHTVSNLNPRQRVRAWLPGLVTGYSITHDLAFFVGGQWMISSVKDPNRTVTSGFQSGSRLEADLSWAYPTQGTKGNALSMGGTYDLTYKLYGIGATHHWPSFSLGIHYVINADEERVLPLVGVNMGWMY